MLAGCNSSNDNSDAADSVTNGSSSASGKIASQTQTTESESGIIERAETSTTEYKPRLSMKKTTTVLDVSLADTSVDAVALRDSSGSEVTRNSPGTSTTTRFELTTLPAGTYDVLAVKGGSIVDQVSRTWTRSFSVEDMALSKQGSEGIKTVSATITATGDLPVNITGMHVYGEVPNSKDGEYAPLEYSLNNPTAAAGKSQTITAPFSPLTTHGITCDGKPRTGKIDLTTEIGEKTTTLTFTFSLSGSLVGLDNKCTEGTITSFELMENK